MSISSSVPEALPEAKPDAQPEAPDSVEAGPASASASPASASPSHPATIGAIALAALGLLTACIPLSTDLYLSTFPAMMQDLHTTASGVQFSLSGLLLGAGAGQLIFGPLSDRWGRRWPLLLGLLLFIAAGVGAALATSIGVLVALRVLQGIGGAAGTVIARVIVTDRLRGAQATKTIGLLMAITGVAPAVAPVVGSALAAALGWRGLLWILVALGVVAVLLVLATLPESHPRQARAASARTGSGRDLLSRQYLGNTVLSAAIFVSLLAYISASPFVYEHMMGLSETGYAVGFGINAVGMLVVTVLSGRLAHLMDTTTWVRLGLGLHLLGAAVFVVLAVSAAPTWVLLFPLFVAVASLGLIMGNSTALALHAVRSGKGLASAVLGCAQFALGAVGSAIVGAAGENPAVALGLTMLGAGVVAAGASLAAGRAKPAA